MRLTHSLCQATLSKARSIWSSNKPVQATYLSCFPGEQEESSKNNTLYSLWSVSQRERNPLQRLLGLPALTLFGMKPRSRPFHLTITSPSKNRIGQVTDLGYGRTFHKTLERFPADLDRKSETSTTLSKFDKRVLWVRWYAVCVESLHRALPNVEIRTSEWGTKFRKSFLPAHMCGKKSSATVRFYAYQLQRVLATVPF